MMVIFFSGNDQEQKCGGTVAGDNRIGKNMGNHKSIRLNLDQFWFHFGINNANFCHLAAEELLRGASLD